MAEERGKLEELAVNATDDSGDGALERRAEETTQTDAPADDDAQQIREQIEETRSQMSETIDAIQDKLSIANITEQVKDQVSEQIGGAVESVKDAFFDKTGAVAKTIGKSFAQFGESDASKKVQENPWILSVAGMGIGAVLVGTLFGGKKRKSISYRYKSSDGEEKNAYTSQTRQTFASAGEPRKSASPSVPPSAAASDFQADETRTTGESDGRTANSAGRSIGDKAGEIYENIGKASSYTYEKASDLGDKMKKNYSSYIEENPLAVGAAVFAVGAVIGYAIPLTDVENKYFGGMRDNVVEKAQASAQEAVDSVKQMAGDAKKIIADEVSSQLAAK